MGMSDLGFQTQQAALRSVMNARRGLYPMTEREMADVMSRVPRDIIRREIIKREQEIDYLKSWLE